MKKYTYQQGRNHEFFVVEPIGCHNFQKLFCSIKVDFLKNLGDPMGSASLPLVSPLYHFKVSENGLVNSLDGVFEELTLRKYCKNVTK